MAEVPLQLHVAGSMSLGQLMPLLKSTTRHIHIFTAEVQNNELIESDNVLTLDVDPDNELNWNDDALQKVYQKFDELVESSGGQDLTEYNLRRIGSDLEHFVRSLLNKGEISYNLNSRVMNYSMGLPQVNFAGESTGTAESITPPTRGRGL